MREQEVAKAIEALAGLYVKETTEGLQLAAAPYDSTDIALAVDALLDGWPTMGRRTASFEARFSEIVRGRQAVMVNSGGSANLLALYLLTSPYVDEGIRLMPGDEIVTPAVTWATSMAPILQVGCVPVLVDVEPATLGICPRSLESSISPRTRAVLAVHTLGRPCDLAGVLKVCDHHKLILVEDACDALGATYRGQSVGTFGLLATFSLYFSHHITAIEGGIIVTESNEMADALRAMRANGWVREVRSEKLRNRIIKDSPDIDSSFLFPFIGFNFKPTDVAAGLVAGQLSRLPNIIEARARVADRLTSALAPRAGDQLLLPTVARDVRHSWLAYPIIVSPQAPFTRAQLTDFLRRAGIPTRPILAGNITKQPFMKDFGYRRARLPNADLIHTSGFFLGLHHQLSSDDVEFIADRLLHFVDQFPQLDKGTAL